MVRHAPGRLCICFFPCTRISPVQLYHSLHPASPGAILSAADISSYLDAILRPGPSTLPQHEILQCPALDVSRYKVLKPTRTAKGEPIHYFFALDLRECLDLLPRLLGTIIRAIDFLGPSSCAISIVEGNSPDGTADVLAALKAPLKDLGIAYFFLSSTIDPSEGNRVERLAHLRNLALEPLWSQPTFASEQTTILFLNDVAICPEDVLELALQREQLDADMTCAMDWTHVSSDPTFYDVWIARTMRGNSFFEIPPDGSWDSAWHLFRNEAKSAERYASRRPFQVFSCWNGAAVFTAAPLLSSARLRFRSSNVDAGECEQGEPVLFCKDMWFYGHGKIAVVPSVNLEYSDEKAKSIKKTKGFVSDIVSKQDRGNDTIQWQLDPPAEILCMPSWNNQYWQLWNYTL